LKALVFHYLLPCPEERGNLTGGLSPRGIFTFRQKREGQLGPSTPTGRGRCRGPEGRAARPGREQGRGKKGALLSPPWTEEKRPPGKRGSEFLSTLLRKGGGEAQKGKSISPLNREGRGVSIGEEIIALSIHRQNKKSPKEKSRLGSHYLSGKKKRYCSAGPVGLDPIGGQTA